MIYAKLALLILLSISSSRAEHIHWLGDYDKALQIAHQTHKDMMVLLVQRDSLASRDTIARNFMNREYIETLDSRFVCAIVTYQSRASYPIELYYSTTFPALFFVSSKDERFLIEPLYGSEIDEFFDRGLSRAWGSPKP